MDASERSLGRLRTLPDPKLTPAHYDLTSESSGDRPHDFAGTDPMFPQVILKYSPITS